MNRWLPFEWIAAVRFLREGRLQTLFIIGGVAIGVAVIVFMSAMLAGLEANFIKRVLTSQPQIQILPPDQVARPLRGGAGEFEDARVQRPSQRILSIDQWPKIRTQMLAMPEVTAVSPTMSGSALAVRGDASRAISLSGVEPESYFKIVRVPDYIVAGEPRLTSDDIIIGIELAKDLGATVGDKLNVQAATGASRVLTITGLVDLGNKGANQRAAYVALRTAQSLLGMIGGVTTIDLTVNDIYAAETIAQQIQAANAVEADSWIKTNAQFFTAVQAQKTSNTLIRLFVALSVAFGIAAVLVVSVDPALARRSASCARWAPSRGQILRVFLLQGGLLGFVGSLFGSAWAQSRWSTGMRSRARPTARELFPLILDRQLFLCTAILATLTGSARGDGTGAARRQTRSGGGDPWLTTFCASTKSLQVLQHRPAVRDRGAARHRPDAARGRIRRADGAVRLRQEHAAQHHRPARSSDLGPPVHHGPRHRRAGRRRDHALARPQHRLRVPVSPPDLGVHGRART